MRLILRELNPKYLIPCSPHAYHVRCLGAESTVNSSVGPGGEGGCYTMGVTVSYYAKVMQLLFVTAAGEVSS